MTLDIFNNQITLKMSQYMMNQGLNHKTKLGPTIEMGTFLIYSYIAIVATRKTPPTSGPLPTQFLTMHFSLKEF